MNCTTNFVTVQVAPASIFPYQRGNAFRGFDVTPEPQQPSGHRLRPEIMNGMPVAPAHVCLPPRCLHVSMPVTPGRASSKVGLGSPLSTLMLPGSGRSYSPPRNQLSAVDELRKYGWNLSPYRVRSLSAFGGDINPGSMTEDC